MPFNRAWLVLPTKRPKKDTNGCSARTNVSEQNGSELYARSADIKSEIYIVGFWSLMWHMRIVRMCLSVIVTDYLLWGSIQSVIDVTLECRSSSVT